MRGIIKKILRESDFEWIQDQSDYTNYVDLVMDKAVAFDNAFDSRNYNKIISFLLELGFLPEYNTPKILHEDEGVEGIYIYRRKSDNQPVYVYTPWDEEEWYGDHIEAYARIQSADNGENLKLVSVKEFLNIIGE